MNTALYVKVAYCSGTGNVWRVPKAVRVRMRKHRHFILA